MLQSENIPDVSSDFYNINDLFSFGSHNFNVIAPVLALIIGIFFATYVGKKIKENYF